MRMNVRKGIRVGSLEVPLIGAALAPLVLFFTGASVVAPFLIAIMAEP